MDDRRSSPSHDPGTRKGEEQPGGGEPGREERGKMQTGRPMGKSDARFSTGINAEDENPIDPASPDLPPA